MSWTMKHDVVAILLTEMNYYFDMEMQHLLLFVECDLQGCLGHYATYEGFFHSMFTCYVSFFSWHRSFDLSGRYSELCQIKLAPVEKHTPMRLLFVNVRLCYRPRDYL